MASVLYHEAAARELLQAVGFLELQAKGLGRRFLREVQRCEDLISAFPSGSPEIAPGVRRHPLRKFSYGLLYSVEPEGPLVIAVANHRRRPDHSIARTTDSGEGS